MSNELIVATKTEAELWSCETTLLEIKELYAPKANNSEFKMLVGLGRATGLNPYLKEIWCVKYDEKRPAAIFIGRDGYRKSAQRHPNYEHHQVDAVYENDDFSVKDCIPSHSYNLKNRGKLLGAYACVKLKDCITPFFVFLDLKEYDKKQSNWLSMPATMIKKCAESQCFRMAMQELFSGTHSDAEMYHVTEREVKQVDVEVADLNNRLGLLPQYDMSKLCRQLGESKTLEELEKNFKECYKTAKSNPDHINVLTEIKDRIKQDLQKSTTTEVIEPTPPITTDLDESWEEFKNEN